MFSSCKYVTVIIIIYCILFFNLFYYFPPISDFYKKNIYLRVSDPYQFALFYYFPQ